ncbi:MAG: hypothetical protein OIN90_09610, partial [Candidatus Methanoperedens sp.]|nr:hypothetical protein [Candidatus Methanoperedens sp.]
MNRKLLLILFALIVILIAAIFYYDIKPSVTSKTFPEIKLPQGFRIDSFAENIAGTVSYPGQNPGPRMMLLKDGVLFVTVPNIGRVVALPDWNNDKKADETILFIENLNNPHGIDYYEGWFYIAEENRVIRVKDNDDNLIADRDTIEVLIDDLPTGGHSTRTLKIHNNSLFVSIGSSCNVCIEENERRAAIMKCTLDGKDCKVFAKGLRNAVGMVIHPVTGQMYATENGRDYLGDDLPPDEI